MAKKLVSVVIPCYNAQAWIAQAIDSCLQQTYQPLEIIVIDDGSTDRSLEIIKRYDQNIYWETGCNQGGNKARNRGFSLAQGEYIQFLDADDYLLPEKIAAQVECLETQQGDVAYGDWRYQVHFPNGTSELEPIQVAGPKKDFLESLLSNEEWVAASSVLYTRHAVEKCGGWDENLPAAQDRDLLMRTALEQAKFVHQSGCYSIYRRYGNNTVSRSSRRRWIDSHCQVMAKAEKHLVESGRLSPKYRLALAKGYFNMGREYLYCDYPMIDANRYQHFLKLLEKTFSLCPGFKSQNPKMFYNWTQNLFGCRFAEQVSYWLIKLKGKVQSGLLLAQTPPKSLDSIPEV